MYRIFIVTLITAIAFFLHCFSIFAAGGTGGGNSESTSSSSDSKSASSSTAALPGLQPPSLGTATFGGMGSSSSAIPAVLPPLSVGSLTKLFEQILSSVNAGTTMLGNRLGGIEYRLGDLERTVGVLNGRVENLEDAENGGAKALVISPELRAKVAAAVENRKLSEGSESELFTSDELQELQDYFHKNYNLKNVDVYNICLLFLSLNIGSMPLDLHNKDAFNYRLIFCLLENILSSNSDATKFQFEKGKILHCALVIFNKYNIISKASDEKIWFYRRSFNDIDLQKDSFFIEEYLSSEKHYELYVKELLAQAFQESDDPLWQNLALEACFYAVLHKYKYGIDIILDKDFFEKSLRREFDTYNEHMTNDKNIFELLSAKIVFFFSVHLFSQSIPNQTVINININLDASFPEMHENLKRRIILAYILLKSAGIFINCDDDNTYNPKNHDEKKRLQAIRERADENFFVLAKTFEMILKIDLINLKNLPDLDKIIFMDSIIRNAFFCKRFYYLELSSLEQNMHNLQKGEERKEFSLVFLSSLFYYFQAMREKSGGEMHDYANKMNLLQKCLEEEIKNFEAWQRENKYSPLSSILLAYNIFPHIMYNQVQDNSFEFFPIKLQITERKILEQLWEQTFSHIYQSQRVDFSRSHKNKRMLDIYVHVLVGTLVTTTLVYQQEKGTLPSSIKDLIPMDLGIFRTLLKENWAPFIGDVDKRFLSCILYLLYPEDIFLKDLGLRKDLSLEDIDNWLREHLETPNTLHGRQKDLIKEFLGFAKQE